MNAAVPGSGIEKRARASTSVQVTEHNILVFRVKGLVTPDIGTDLVDQIERAVLRYKPRAAVADYRGALIAADPRTMVDVIEKGMFSHYDRRALLLGPMGTPAAALVSSAALPQWQEYGWLMAVRLGLMRGAFTEDEEALSWVQERARVREQELARLRDAGSGLAAS